MYSIVINMLLNLCLCNTFDNSLSRSMPITVRGMLCGRISNSASIPHQSFKLRKASQRPQDRWGSFGSPCLSRLGWPIWHSKENRYLATMCIQKQKRIMYTRRASTTRLKGKRNKIVTFKETISVQRSRRPFSQMISISTRRSENDNTPRLTP